MDDYKNPYAGLNQDQFEAKLTEEDPRYPARKAALEALDTFTDDWITAYEWTDGENGYYAPSENERALIHDAVAGLLGDSEYERLHAAWKSLCGHGDPVAAAQTLHATVLSIVSELMKADPHTDTSAGRVLDALAKAVETYELATVPPYLTGSAGNAGVPSGCIASGGTSNEGAK